MKEVSGEEGERGREKEEGQKTVERGECDEEERWNREVKRRGSR